LACGRDSGGNRGSNMGTDRSPIISYITTLVNNLREANDLHPTPATMPPTSRDNSDKIARGIPSFCLQVFFWPSSYCLLKVVASLPGLDVNGDGVCDRVAC
jgi:hypothetical protein